jgi:hypothetical protein
MPPAILTIPMEFKGANASAILGVLENARLLRVGFAGSSSTFGKPKNETIDYKLVIINATRDVNVRNAKTIFYGPLAAVNNVPPPIEKDAYGDDVPSNRRRLVDGSDVDDEEDDEYSASDFLEHSDSSETNEQWYKAVRDKSSSSKSRAERPRTPEELATQRLLNQYVSSYYAGFYNFMRTSMESAHKLGVGPPVPDEWKEAQPFTKWLSYDELLQDEKDRSAAMLDKRRRLAAKPVVGTKMQMIVIIPSVSVPGVDDPTGAAVIELQQQAIKTIISDLNTSYNAPAMLKDANGYLTIPNPASMVSQFMPFFLGMKKLGFNIDISIDFDGIISVYSFPRFVYPIPPSPLYTPQESMTLSGGVMGGAIVVGFMFAFALRMRYARGGKLPIEKQKVWEKTMGEEEEIEDFSLSKEVLSEEDRLIRKYNDREVPIRTKRDRAVVEAMRSLQSQKADLLRHHVKREVHYMLRDPAVRRRLERSRLRTQQREQEELEVMALALKAAEAQAAAAASGELEDKRRAAEAAAAAKAASDKAAASKARREKRAALRRRALVGSEEDGEDSWGGGYDDLGVKDILLGSDSEKSDSDEGGEDALVPGVVDHDDIGISTSQQADSSSPQKSIASRGEARGRLFSPPGLGGDESARASVLLSATGTVSPTLSAVDTSVLPVVMQGARKVPGGKARREARKAMRAKTAEVTERPGLIVDAPFSIGTIGETEVSPPGDRVISIDTLDPNGKAAKLKQSSERLKADLELKTELVGFGVPAEYKLSLRERKTIERQMRQLPTTRRIAAASAEIAAYRATTDTDTLLASLQVQYLQEITLRPLDPERNNRGQDEAEVEFDGGADEDFGLFDVQGDGSGGDMLSNRPRSREGGAHASINQEDDILGAVDETAAAHKDDEEHHDDENEHDEAQLDGLMTEYLEMVTTDHDREVVHLKPHEEEGGDILQAAQRATAEAKAAEEAAAAAEKVAASSETEPAVESTSEFIEHESPTVLKREGSAFMQRVRPSRDLLPPLATHSEEDEEDESQLAPLPGDSPVKPAKPSADEEAAKKAAADEEAAAEERRRAAADRIDRAARLELEPPSADVLLSRVRNMYNVQKASLEAAGAAARARPTLALPADDEAKAAAAAVINTGLGLGLAGPTPVRQTASTYSVVRRIHPSLISSPFLDPGLTGGPPPMSAGPPPGSAFAVNRRMAGATIEPIPIRPGSVGAPRLAPSARSSVGGSLRAIEPKQTAWGVPSGGDSIPTPGGGRIVDYQAAFAAPGGNTTTSGIQRTSSLSRTGSATVSRQTGAAGAIPPQQQQQQQLRRLPPGLGSVTQTSRRTSNAASGEKPEDAWS